MPASLSGSLNLQSDTLFTQSSSSFVNLKQLSPEVTVNITSLSFSLWRSSFQFSAMNLVSFALGFCASQDPVPVLDSMPWFYLTENYALFWTTFSPLGSFYRFLLVDDKHNIYATTSSPITHSPGADFQKGLKSKVCSTPVLLRFDDFLSCMIHKLMKSKHYPSEKVSEQSLFCNLI